jgi:protein-L-isoaspartate(D-aspartate) O-methyltransferase
MAGITQDAAAPDREAVAGIAAAAEPFPTIEDADLSGFLDRVGDARVVLLGECTHGTSEFYRLRARITRALVEEKGFRIVGLEADWPDAAALDHYVRDLPGDPPPEPPFRRFPSWMWANRELLELVHALRRVNERRPSPDPSAAVGVYGLDLYSLYASIAAVLQYLDDVDPEAAAVARERYACLSPWEGDPAGYGHDTLSGRFRECEKEVMAALQDLLHRRFEYTRADSHRFLDAVQNARLITAAESYYRAVYYGSRTSWNLRDQHMFDTLESLLDFRGGNARAVVWAHNSHLGDASATEMGARGEHNLGELCRRRLGDAAYLVGFGTDRGTVAAASSWGGEMEIKEVRSSRPGSYELLCHEAGPERFHLPLRRLDPELRQVLLEPRLERAIGVVYRPETELASHYFQAVLPRQFDEWIWLDETRAVTPLGREADEDHGLDTSPFGI